MKFCTNCGNQLTPEQRFCTKCGAPVKGAPEAVAPAPVVEAPVIETPVVEEPAPAPVVETPAPVVEPVAPAPVIRTPDYPNVLQIVLALSKAGVVDDVVDQPTDLAPAAFDAWQQDRLAAFTHNWGGAEFRVFIADANLDASSYANLTGSTQGLTGARFGSWNFQVVPSSGQANESAVVLEKVFELLG